MSAVTWPGMAATIGTPAGTVPDGGTDAPAWPRLVRHGTPPDYERQAQAAADARAADVRALMDAAAPIVQIVEALLNGGLALHRLISESGVSAADTHHLIQRREPHADGGPVDYGWNDARMRAAVQLWAAWAHSSATAQPRPLAPLPTYRTLYNLMAQAQQGKRLLVIVGGVGVGKTCAAQAVCAARARRPEAPGAVRVEVREADRSMWALLRRLHAGVTHREFLPAGRQAMTELCKVLRAGDVLILDEAQRLAHCANGRGVELVRELYDNTPASLVLLGNEEMHQRGNVLDRSRHAALLGRARVYAREFLRPREEDVDVFMAWRCLSGIELRRWLVEIVTAPDAGPRGTPLPGGVRLLADLCDRVEEAFPGQPVTVQTLRAVLGV